MNELLVSFSLNKMTIPMSWHQSKSRRRTEIVVVGSILLVYNGVHGQSHDKQWSSRPLRFNYPSFLDDLVKGYTDLKDMIDAQSTQEEMGFAQNLWSAGKKRSMSMIEGVRKGGEQSLFLDIDMDMDMDSSSWKSSTALDRLAQSFSVKLAWVVGVQALLNAFMSHRQSLLEVGIPGCDRPFVLLFVR